MPVVSHHNFTGKIKLSYRFQPEEVSIARDNIKAIESSVINRHSLSDLYVLVEELLHSLLSRHSVGYFPVFALKMRLK